MTDDIEIKTNEGYLIGPGARLRMAREGLRLTVAEVARQLRLKPNLVELMEDIENSDFSRLPRPVFLKGYVRAYAKLLRLPGDELIHALDVLYSNAPVLAPAPVVAPTRFPDLDVASGYGKVAIGFAVLVAVVLMIVWQGRKSAVVEPPPVVTPVVESAKPAAPKPLTLNDAPPILAETVIQNTLEEKPSELSDSKNDSEVPAEDAVPVPENSSDRH